MELWSFQCVLSRLKSWDFVVIVIPLPIIAQSPCVTARHCVVILPTLQRCAFATVPDCSPASPHISPVACQSTPQLHVFDTQSLPGIEPATESSPSNATTVGPYLESVRGLQPVKSHYLVLFCYTNM